MSLLNNVLEVFPDAGAWGSHLWQSTLFVGVCWLAARSRRSQGRDNRKDIESLEED